MSSLTCCLKMLLTKPLSSSRAPMHVSAPLCAGRGTGEAIFVASGDSKAMSPMSLQILLALGEGFPAPGSSQALGAPGMWLRSYSKGDGKPLEGLKQTSGLI